MNILETLLGRRWILKNTEKELYYQIKDELGSVQDFLVEKLGYQVIVNPYLIKVEKIPAKPENWMGILAFKEKSDYIFLCYILMFLEDKEREEQFVLSELTEYVASQCHELPVDWTVYSYRRSLIRVMKFCEQNGMILVNDGTEEDFSKDFSSEVLYENTGVSRYFMKNFTQDISGYQNPEDFETVEWIGMNEDRGVARRQRVYRRLMMTMGMIREPDTEEDFEYVKHYHHLMEKEVSDYLDCELHVHKGSAFLILGEDSRMGRRFPEERSISDIVLLCCNILCEEIKNGKYQLPPNEHVCIEREELERIIEKCRLEYGSGFIKAFREMTTTEFTKQVWEYMLEMELIREKENRVLLSPVIGKIVGRYPQDFKIEKRKEPEKNKKE